MKQGIRFTTSVGSGKGPGVVIGQDGVVIFVCHGGTYVRVHQLQGMLRERDNQLMETENATLPETRLYKT